MSNYSIRMSKLSTKVVRDKQFFRLTSVKPSEIFSNKSLKEVITNWRVIQNEIVYVIGLSPNLSEKSVLFKRFSQNQSISVNMGK